MSMYLVFLMVFFMVLEFDLAVVLAHRLLGGQRFVESNDAGDDRDGEQHDCDLIMKWKVHTKESDRDFINVKLSPCNS